MAGWKRAKTPKSCNAFPAVWAAIVGCTGEGTAWRYGVGHFGRSEAEYACPVCRAATDRFDSLVGTAHQDALRAAQDAAGVADYRLAEVEWIGGRPRLTGKVDASLAYEAADAELREYANGAGPQRAANALRVLCQAGGNGRPLVASYRLSAAQRAALVAAYRRAS